MLDEPGSAALRRMIGRGPWLASALTVAEAVRAIRRRHPDLRDVPAELGRADLLPVDDHVLGRAALLDPPGLRMLDAIHLATVLLAGHHVDALVTYDGRLAAAAEAHGVNVLSPS